MRFKLTFLNVSMKQAQKLCSYAKKNQIINDIENIKVVQVEALDSRSG